jgi:tetratricopeptide (TPR) repeat protein
LYRQKKYEDAIELFNLVLEKGENYSALSGLSESLAEMNKRDSAIVLLKTYLNKFESTGYYYNLEFRLADLYAESSDIKSADLLYRKLILQNPNTTLYYLSELRRVLGEREDLLTEYVSGEDSLKYSILKSLNKNKYYYSSFPAIVNLSQSVGEEYEVFVEQFDKKLIVNVFLSAYGVYQLSQYMLEKLDFTRARRMAALTLRYTADKNLNLLFNDNFKKINWFYTNSNLVLNNISNIKQNYCLSVRLYFFCIVCLYTDSTK